MTNALELILTNDRRRKNHGLNTFIKPDVTSLDDSIPEDPKEKLPNYSDLPAQKAGEMLSPITNIDFVNSAELTASPESLRGHIVNTHFNPEIMAFYGVARYDIEVCAYRGIRLDWVVKKIYGKLERSDKDIAAEIRKHMKWLKLKYQMKTPQDYRVMLVRNLKYIEQLRLADVDWDRVEKTIPCARTIKLDIGRDGGDSSYKKKFNPYAALRETGTNSLGSRQGI